MAGMGQNPYLLILTIQMVFEEKYHHRLWTLKTLLVTEF